MKSNLTDKYRAYSPIELPERTWPNKKIREAPRWCSVDLRDGNQALAVPMRLETKMELYSLLLHIGFREIEVGFPAASASEFAFLRGIIEQELIPEGVHIQVLTQAREHLIVRTFEALEGIDTAVLHLYNSTSPQQRKLVFRKGRSAIKDIAVQGARLVREMRDRTDTKIILEYSPESYSATECDFALEVCNAVMEVWEPTQDNPIILNLPATVEMSTPNIYADQIEWFIHNLPGREKAIISVHPHNDRGTAVAAAELALMAGADRVEGTLFGNGERTGNVDILTLALNLYTQGIDPHLDLHDMDRIVGVYERSTRMDVHPRHPYAGELVYTAFSGSHQDAIRKGFAARTNQSDPWDVPYLPLDPADLGRTYEAVIRINSQSGKGGAAHVLEQKFGYRLPREMLAEFGSAVQKRADELEEEIAPEEIDALFVSNFLEAEGPFALLECRLQENKKGEETVAELNCKTPSGTVKLEGRGAGPLHAVRNALIEVAQVSFRVADYHEHALSRGADARAVAYVQIEIDERTCWGAGVDRNIAHASIKALFAALNRGVGNRGVGPSGIEASS